MNAIAETLEIANVFFDEAPRCGQQVWITMTNGDTDETWHLPATVLSVAARTAPLTGFACRLHMPVSLARMGGEPQP